MPIHYLDKYLETPVKQNKIVLTQPHSKKTYSCLILCQLNYGILIWGQNYKRIFKLQKRVMQIITDM